MTKQLLSSIQNSNPGIIPQPIIVLQWQNHTASSTFPPHDPVGSMCHDILALLSLLRAAAVQKHFPVNSATCPRHLFHTSLLPDSKNEGIFLNAHLLEEDNLGPPSQDIPDRVHNHGCLSSAGLFVLDVRLLLHRVFCILSALVDAHCNDGDSQVVEEVDQDMTEEAP